MPTATQLFNDNPITITNDTKLSCDDVSGITGGIRAEDIKDYVALVLSGDVSGPASAVDQRIAVFDGTTGKLLEDGGKTIPELRVPAIQTVTSSATVTPTFSNDMVIISAQAAGLTLANPTGTAIDGLGLVIRIKDNGTSRSITFGSQYRAIDVTLPTDTVISKWLYIGMIFNNADTKWDVVSVAQEA